MVTTNSGFGGVNVALLVGLKPSNKTRPVEQAKRAPQIVEHDYRIPTSELTDKPLFVTPKHFARFSPDAQRASLAVASLLSKEGLLLDEDRLLRWDRQERPQACVGLVVWLPEGSAKMNRTYFEDYVATGSILGRGQLFAATLPTAVASEVAIALRFTGPLLYVAESEGTVRPALKVARDVLQDGLAEAMVVLAIHENEVHVAFMKEGGL
jgi:hypothetical protein